nr:MAG TPA: hypothetical protein [Caudoviricetes sp.]
MTDSYEEYHSTLIRAPWAAGGWQPRPPELWIKLVRKHGVSVLQPRSQQSWRSRLQSLRLIGHQNIYSTMLPGSKIPPNYLANVLPANCYSQFRKEIDYGLQI